MVAFAKYLIVTFIVVIMLYNIVAWSCERPEWTVSHMIRQWAKEHPIIVFLAGMCAGHWFWFE